VPQPNTRAPGSPYESSNTRHFFLSEKFPWELAMTASGKRNLQIPQNFLPLKFTDHHI
jgi:hypothetical protein